MIDGNIDHRADELANAVIRANDLAHHYETEWGKCAAHLNEIAGERDRLRAEVERLTKERDHWEEEARRYCQNADFWRGERDQIIDRCVEVCDSLCRELVTRDQGFKADGANLCAAAIRAMKGE